MIAFASFFPVLLNTYSGVRSVDPVQVQTPANVYAPNPADAAVGLSPNGAYSDGQTTTGAVYFFDTAKFGAQIGRAHV